jgi:exopolyphosphatase/guanosine-5'-triphosphate,3'-diphosphate pyrophosphatase
MPSQPARLAVIDLGSGTVNLAVFEAGRDGLRNVHRRSTTLRLLAGVTAGELRADALEGALAVLRGFVDEARAHGAEEPLLLATSAVRDASNRAELAERLLAERGVSLRVVDGGDEARMAARAVLHTLPLRDGCVVDLGGGSLQVAEVRGRRVRRAASLPVGSLRLLLTHPTGAVPAPEVLSAMRREVDAALDAVPWLRALEGDVVGCGGTFRTLARVDRAARGAAQVHPHGQLLTRDAVESLLEAASRMTEAERGTIPGVPAHRADLLVPGALVVARLLLHLHVTACRTSSVGIREGALL